MKQLTEKAAEMSRGGLCPAEGWKLSTAVVEGKKAGEISQWSQLSLRAEFQQRAIRSNFSLSRSLETSLPSKGNRASTLWNYTG